ncbi:MAG: hypothetical protein GY832_26155 [Chloroflexi bacterium]|nr:hypothetical protein [Chloroflexota bacterium]
MMKPITAISLGWGVQSFALAAMSALDTLPPVDAVIHADTTHERSETYKFAARWTPWLEAQGLNVITTSDKKATRHPLDPNTKQTHVPLYTLSPQGKHGQTRRSCTQRWKIAPMRRVISALLQERGMKKAPGAVIKWLGITLDEVQRARKSDVKYVELQYPFLTMFDKPMRRSDVVDWLIEHDLEVPVKSSCYFCPYHNMATWREIQAGPDWKKALAVDEIIRHKRPGFLSYLHSSCRPLTDIDFRSQEEHGQLALWEDDECSGTCFL